MQYLGEFLSPQNSISKDQDQLTKYFYFRPDSYDNPDADVENIFKIREMTQFPKRYDVLVENELYGVDSISVSKRVSDEEPGVINVSYVVTATYDLLDNIRKREQTQTSEPETGTVVVDEDGNKVTGTQYPWKQRAVWNFQPKEVVIPFLKAYKYTQGASSWNEKSVDVRNAAKCRLFSETVRYQLEITYTKNYKLPQSWENITQAFVNSDTVDFNFDYRGSFAPKTLLIKPPTYSRQWTEVDVLDDEGNPETDGSGNVKKELVGYYTYTVTMIYDPQGHDKKLLNVGTYALFGNDPVPRQIWEVTKIDSNTGSVIDGFPKWLSSSDALKEQALALNQGQQVTASPVSEPIPLTDTGTIDEAAIKDPTQQYKTLTFTQYPGMSFSNLPFKN